MEDFLQIEEDIADIRNHIRTLNEEGAEMRDEQRKMNEEITEIKVGQTEIKTDVSWLKQFFWIIATTSIGSVIASILNLILKR